MILQRKRWQDLSPRQKRGITLLGVVQLVLLAAALWDIRKRSPEEIYGSKRWWTPALFVNFIGPIAYFVFGRKR